MRPYLPSHEALGAQTCTPDRGSRPVRIGNGAYSQFQLDVLGEFAVTLFEYAGILGELTPRAREALENCAHSMIEGG